ncbi:hypothetical protein J2Z48_001772 [Croceifilum oryzae]|uniref:Immunity protein 8 n=1 Tax=Croceifilum oryzae TaxID=1553429 RepID=A0AAJ1TFK7_9BACL|nr:Imm8 family immunity protein [Croceifilum oryzae]MDQ0417599.1 hypothetical protein [Croceifilum oryzae]
MIKILSLIRDYEDWGEGEDDFVVQYELQIGLENSADYSNFSFDVISPKRLERSICDKDIEIGYGLMIMTDFNTKLVEHTVERLVRMSFGKDYDETVCQLSRYFRRRMDRDD